MKSRTCPVLSRPLQFDIPREATADGKLDLAWYREPGLGGAGRGNAAAEVWSTLKSGIGGGTQ